MHICYTQTLEYIVVHLEYNHFNVYFEECFHAGKATHIDARGIKNYARIGLPLHPHVNAMNQTAGQAGAPG